MVGEHTMKTTPETPVSAPTGAEVPTLGTAGPGTDTPPAAGAATDADKQKEKEAQEAARLLELEEILSEPRNHVTHHLELQDGIGACKRGLNGLSVAIYGLCVAFIVAGIIGISAMAWCWRNNGSIGKVSDSVTALETKVNGQAKTVTDAAESAKQSEANAGNSALRAKTSENTGGVFAISAQTAAKQAEESATKANESAQTISGQATTVSETAAVIETAKADTLKARDDAKGLVANANGTIKALRDEIKGLKDGNATLATRLETSLAENAKAQQNQASRLDGVEKTAAVAKDGITALAISPNKLFKGVPKTTKEELQHKLDEAFPGTISAARAEATSRKAARKTPEVVEAAPLEPLSK